MAITSEQLRLLRTLTGLRAEDVANHIGTSKVYVTLIENGVRRLTEDVERRILAVYGLTPGDFKEGGEQHESTNDGH